MSHQINRRDFLDVYNDPLETNPLKSEELSQEARQARRRLEKAITLMEKNINLNPQNTAANLKRKKG